MFQELVDVTTRYIWPSDFLRTHVPVHTQIVQDVTALGYKSQQGTRHSFPCKKLQNMFCHTFLVRFGTINWIWVGHNKFDSQIASNHWITHQLVVTLKKECSCKGATVGWTVWAELSWSADNRSVSTSCRLPLQERSSVPKQAALEVQCPVARGGCTPAWPIHQLSWRMSTTTISRMSWRGREKRRKSCALWRNSVRYSSAV